MRLETELGTSHPEVGGPFRFVLIEFLPMDLKAVVVIDFA